jgi:hypothetical protein
MVRTLVKGVFTGVTNFTAFTPFSLQAFSKPDLQLDDFLV